MRQFKRPLYELIGKDVTVMTEFACVSGTLEQPGNNGQYTVKDGSNDVIFREKDVHFIMMDGKTIFIHLQFNPRLTLRQLAGRNVVFSDEYSIINGKLLFSSTGYIIVDNSGKVCACFLGEDVTVSLSNGVILVKPR